MARIIWSTACFGRVRLGRSVRERERGVMEMVERHDNDVKILTTAGILISEVHKTLFVAYTEMAALTQTNPRI
jgi:hypothetical protein